ncbi:IS3 family transposase [Kribbella sp. NBC_00359]|uniref:IS3 family transposase n=1 Tax=Kribbella sp. NBC_00359 TaxID=2975966 RepID=UPI002E212880
MKVRAVVSLKAEHRLDVLLQAAGLARSTFFYHQARLQDPDPRAELKAAITDVFTKSHARYGHRRVHHELVRAGWQVAKKTVLTLMRQLRLICRSRRKKQYVSYQGQTGQVAPNLLDRDFTAGAPNQKWVTDVTEFRIGDDKLYLSPVMDLFDRQIIAYSLQTSPNLQLTNSSLRAALATLDDGAAPAGALRLGIPVPARLLAAPADSGRGNPVDVSQGQTATTTP